MRSVISGWKADIKANLIEVFGTSDALIHVNVGLTFFLATAVLLRKHRLGTVIAWGILCTLQIGNEVLDALIEIDRRGQVNWTEAWKDCVATVFWPTVLMLVWPLFRERKQAG